MLISIEAHITCDFLGGGGGGGGGVWIPYPPSGSAQENHSVVYLITDVFR